MSEKGTNEVIEPPPWDERIVVGCWVETMYGPAVCVGLKPHKHRLRLIRIAGVTYIPCVSDVCKNSKRIDFRYGATRYSDSKDIWVLGGGLCDGTRWAVSYLGPPTEESLEVVKLKGPYGEGDE